MIRVWLMALLVLPVWAAESFESVAVGPLPGGWVSLVGEWTGAPEEVRIHAGNAATGRQSLHLTGGEERSATLAIAEGKGDRVLKLVAERWTARGVCDFWIEGEDGGGWRELLQTGEIRVGGFHTPVSVAVPDGMKRLRFVCTSDAGVLLDDVVLLRKGPMAVTGLVVHRPVVPILTRKAVNPALGFTLAVDGDEGPILLEAVEVGLKIGRAADIEAVELVAGGENPSGGFGGVVARGELRGERVVMTAERELVSGANSFWVSVRLKEGAEIDGEVSLRLGKVKAGGKVLEPEAGLAEVSQRLGVGLRLHGDDGSKFFRIPGLATTKAGTLIAVYDVRYGHAGDLPADIDVGVSRSEDGGRNWEPMRIAMDMGQDPKHGYDGVGDPAVLVDEVTGRVWIAALWSHGNRAWNGSGPGLSPEETGQLMLAYSDDDGKTWSKPRNLTKEVKDPAWRLLLNGPGAGITMRDGTLVFAAQYRAADGGETKGKPFATILWSKDRGETWKLGTGARIDTTEAQVAELEDGSLMLNCRDNRGGSRTVLTTKDLGATWTPHVTDRKALIEPVCMASLLRVDGASGTVFYFSNPASARAREDMTLKWSTDGGLTWPEGKQVLYDSRLGAGYSCLAPIGDTHVGVVYEGPSELYFLRIPADSGG
jgi:sialidase-1